MQQANKMPLKGSGPCATAKRASAERIEASPVVDRAGGTLPVVDRAGGTLVASQSQHLSIGGIHGNTVSHNRTV
jgi:hypothetical protein